MAHRVNSCRLESRSFRSTAETWVSTVFTGLGGAGLAAALRPGDED